MLRRILKYLIRQNIQLIARELERQKILTAQNTLPAFANQPSKLAIELPRRIFGAEYITIGDDVSIGPGSMLNAITRYPPDTWRHPDHEFTMQTFQPRIQIGHRVSATNNLTLAAVKEIVIEDDVMFAGNVNLTDAFHGFDKPDVPYKYQPMCRAAPIRIGKACWIGQNVVITPGVSIGEFSIIGANSVVTRDVPARSIAVGAPAKVVKTWREKTSSWERKE